MPVQIDEYGLTQRQRLFCMHYIDNKGNATKAAIDAGYSKTTSYSIGSENLTKPEIKRFLGNCMREAAEKLGITPNYLLSKLKRGVEVCIPELSQTYAENLSEDEKLEADGMLGKATDAKAGVACIAEINRMLGNHAPEKVDSRHKLEGLEDLISECKSQQDSN